MKKKILFFLFIILFSANLFSVTSTKWIIEHKEDFLRGRMKGLSVSSDGFLFLAPSIKKLKSPPEEFYLSIISDENGNIYLGTGHNGRIYRIDTSGNYKLIFDAPEMDVYCLTFDDKGNLYAGTSPNGKIYKISSDGKGEEFFNPEGKYIWDLMWHNNYLWVGVGERGGIYKVNPKGEGEIFFKSPQNHVLCLTTNKKGEILAGTASKGLIYKFTTAGTPTILFESPYEEIKKIIIDKEENIYVATGGKPIELEVPSIGKAIYSKETSITVTAQTPTKEKKTKKTLVTQPGALYKIYPDGRSELLWSSKENSIYSSAFFFGKKEILLATGNEGRIFSVKPETKRINLLTQEECEQIFQFLNSNSKIYFITNNPPSLFSLFPEQGSEGEFLSEVIDTGTISTWGEIKWSAVIPNGTSIQLFTRVGNSHDPGIGWSDWSPPYQKSEGERIFNLKARFIQVKAVLKSSIKGNSPHLSKVSIFYKQDNLAPEITEITLLPPNKVYIKPPSGTEEILGFEELRGKASDSEIKIIPKEKFRKGFQTLKWRAKDPNKDSLVFNIYIKEERDKNWILLKENHKENIYAFETISFPDGNYRIKIIASDSVDNPLGTELKGEKISDIFVIDNTPPVIENTLAVRKGSSVEISFTAKDLASYISKAEYSIKPNEWKIIFPVDGICDSKTEKFQFVIPLKSSQWKRVVLRVYDAFQNSSITRKTF